MKPYKTDKTGEDILDILTADSKASHEDIAKQLGIPASAVTKYIKKFEKDKIILRYRTHINWERIRQEDVRALIEVKVIPERGVGFDAIAESIYRFPEVTALYLISGGFDLLVQVEGQSLKEVAFFVSEKLATLKNVQSTATHFLLKKYKEDGDILTDQPGSDRLLITP